MWEVEDYMELVRRGFGSGGHVIQTSAFDGTIVYETDYDGRPQRKVGYIWVDGVGVAHLTDEYGSEVACADKTEY